MPNDLMIYELFGLQDLVDDGTLVPLGGQVYRFTRDHLHKPIVKPSPTAKPNWIVHLGDIWSASAGAVIHFLGPTGPSPTVQRPFQQSFTFQFDFSGAYEAYAGGVRQASVAPVKKIVDAGPDQTGFEGFQVQLQAKLHHEHGLQRLPFNWVQIEGPVVTLSDRRSLTPTFIAPAVGGLTTLTFRIIATDGCTTYSDDVSILVDGSTSWDSFGAGEWDTLDAEGWDTMSP